MPLRRISHYAPINGPPNYDCTINRLGHDSDSILWVVYFGNGLCMALKRIRKWFLIIYILYSIYKLCRQTTCCCNRLTCLERCQCNWTWGITQNTKGAIHVLIADYLIQWSSSGYCSIRWKMKQNTLYQCVPSEDQEWVHHYSYTKHLWSRCNKFTISLNRNCPNINTVSMVYPRICHSSSHIPYSNGTHQPGMKGRKYYWRALQIVLKKMPTCHWRPAPV